MIWKSIKKNLFKQAKNELLWKSFVKISNFQKQFFIALDWFYKPLQHIVNLWVISERICLKVRIREIQILYYLFFINWNQTFPFYFSAANKCLLKVAMHSATQENYIKAISLYEEVFSLSCFFKVLKKKSTPLHSCKFLERDN